MSRSSGLSTSRPFGGMRRIIRMRSRNVVVKRPTETTNSLDATTETLAEHTESLWLFEPQENVAQEMAGEQVNGSLGAIVVAGSPDIEKDDRLVHGGVEYEVDTVVGHPEDGDADGTLSPEVEFFLVDLVRRHV